MAAEIELFRDFGVLLVSTARNHSDVKMTVLEHLRRILAASIEPQLAEAGLNLTNDRSGYTIARYAGRKGTFEREVTVVRDKWWSKSRGRFTVFLSVYPQNVDSAKSDAGIERCAETNLGHLMESENHDWKIWATDDAGPLIDALSRGMRDFGLPWLESVSDTDGFARYLAEEGY